MDIRTSQAIIQGPQDTETNAACCETRFCMFLDIFRHIPKKSPNKVKKQRKRRFNLHVIKTLAFFRGKSDVHEMRKISIIKTLPTRGSYFVKNAVFSTEKRSFLTRCHERNLTMMSPNGRPSSSRIRSERCSPNDHPKCQEHMTFPLLLLSSPSLSLSLPPLSSLRERLKPNNSLGKTKNDDDSDCFLRPIPSGGS